MFLLSQDETLIVEMYGVYIKPFKKQKMEKTIMTYRYHNDGDVYRVYCISKGILKRDAEASITREYLIGEFRTLERAIKEVRDISCALSKGDIVYEIKQDR